MILLKLYRCFNPIALKKAKIVFNFGPSECNRVNDGLEICMCFLQNPEIIFFTLFSHFNLNYFVALLLYKSIGSRYFVLVTPPIVLDQSF